MLVCVCVCVPGLRGACAGKILYKLKLADVFLVQWPELAQRFPRAKFVDRLY